MNEILIRPLSRGITMLAVLCGLATTLHAERTARILYYKSPAGAPEKAVLYQQGRQPVEVPLPRNNFSEAIELGDDAQSLRFVPDFLEEGETLPGDAPGLKLPQGWQKIVVLAFPDPGNTVLPVKFKAFDASSGRFGAGDLLFINFARASVFGLIGTKKLTLKTGETKVVRSPSASKGDYKVKLDAVPEATGDRQRFLRQTWRHDPTRRQVILVLPMAPPRSVGYYAASIQDWK